MQLPIYDSPGGSTGQRFRVIPNYFDHLLYLALNCAVCLHMYFIPFRVLRESKSWSRDSAEAKTNWTGAIGLRRVALVAALRRPTDRRAINTRTHIRRLHTLCDTPRRRDKDGNL